MGSVRNTINRLSDAFWSESIWLPPNVTWKTYSDRAGGINYAQFNDIYYSLLTAIVILFIRVTLERLIFRPVGKALGISDKQRVKVEPNEILEKSFRINNRPPQSTYIGLSKQSDLSAKQVELWFKRRRSYNKPTILTRFTESSWRCTFYAFTFVYGVWALWDKPWTWDSMECFVDYPHHSVSTEIWWYYNIELGFYISLIISQFFDVKYSDFWQMFIHHVVTVLLLCFSWACNLHRIGTLVLIIHDFADIPLEGAKIARYLRNPVLANIVFAALLVCWIYSRLGLLPTRVIAYSTYYALFILPMFPAYYIFNGLLCALQVLHIIWTWLILKIAHNAIFVDGVKDLRESDDEDDD
ncbi:ceramide synthase 5-like [Panonychus citri]|uniref:ceramide synthase 5-like n=1 Tax=Panonychus citri TaxID=50023 RepID=UPI0023078DCC|nr:ceramide synthase 5-like [Panonychus citri]